MIRKTFGVKVIKELPPIPTEGSKRYFKRYTYLPQTIFIYGQKKRYKLWLEYYYVEQQYDFSGWSDEEYFLDNSEKEKQFKEEMNEIINGK